jgi:type IV secretory pathway VirJ component
MKRTASIASILIMILACPGFTRAGEETFSFGPFGFVHVYEGRHGPSGVVLFTSGDGGWNKGVVDMARALSNLGPTVVGVDIRRYLESLAASSEACLYPAADFEALSKYVQKKLHYPRYSLPMLVGYSSGAALVYAVLAQSPPNTFRGGISLGFCPELALRKPLCRGQGLDAKPASPGRGGLFLPDKKLETPWIVLHGTIDQVCRVDDARSFVGMIPEAELVVLPKVGHGFSVQRNWMPEFKKALERLMQGDAMAAVNSSLRDLPLVEVPAEGVDSKVLAVIVSGDGGWAGLDREVGGALARHGIPVVGLNALQYFWTKRTPESASEDLARILRHYLHAWGKKDVVLVGYSLGADVLPFMANRLPADLLDCVREVVLLGPAREAEFEFHITEWLGAPSEKKALPVLPEVEKLRKKKVLCVYGSGEKDSLCPEVNHDIVESVRMAGGHHFGGQYQTIAEMILARITVP